VVNVVFSRPILKTVLDGIDEFAFLNITNRLQLKMSIRPPFIDPEWHTKLEKAL
jgi:hypothetical protein